MMQQLTDAQLAQILASAIAAMIKNRTSKYGRILTGGCKGPKMRLKVALSREILEFASIQTTNIYTI